MGDFLPTSSWQVHNCSTEMNLPKNDLDTHWMAVSDILCHCCLEWSYRNCTVALWHREKKEVGLPATMTPNGAQEVDDGEPACVCELDPKNFRFRVQNWISLVWAISSSLWKGTFLAVLYSPNVTSREIKKELETLWNSFVGFVFRLR